ncbi:MAG TPA: hypothetical protein PLH19_08045 [Anaerolineae bacterium]|nr:hypothetical protein [Anaerolineae bacterium]HQH38468.1 hypothetical protein [Anaerolineae bacterium]
MLKGHQDMLWLAGQVFLSRNFVKEVEAQGLEAVFATCPYGDLTEQEKAAFRSAFEDQQLQKVVKKWWKVYDEEREAGVVTKSGRYWE